MNIKSRLNLGAAKIKMQKIRLRNDFGNIKTAMKKKNIDRVTIVCIIDNEEAKYFTSPDLNIDLEELFRGIESWVSMGVKLVEIEMNLKTYRYSRLEVREKTVKKYLSKYNIKAGMKIARKLRKDGKI
jgi:hypothetical protein